ncbi:MAG: TIGR02147 family protein [Bdellovibrionaceae bacterium]|nr:TIGR02147 family protein [Pseudobdellovibrionaceae bacterium]
MLSIYSYSEASQFLRDAWKEKKKRNPAFSMSAWAKQLGLENSSPLSLAFKGKRSLPKKYLPQVVQTLGLSGEEGLYLEALVDLSKAKTTPQRLFYLNRLKKLAPESELSRQVVDEYKFLSEPLHTAIIEMTDLKNFRPDPKWIHQKLRLSATLDEVTEALGRLIELKLLKQDFSSGKLYKTHAFLTTENDVADLGTKKFHEAISKFAAEQVYEQSLDEREFGSYSFNLKKGQMSKAKKKIRKFLDEFFQEFEAPAGEGDDTYQFNVQLFRVTK